jgi:hypothetical protein
MELSLNDFSSVRIARNLIGKMRVQCTNHCSASIDEENLNSCNWIGMLDDLEFHMTDVCEIVAIKCLNVGCEKLVQRRSMKSHVNKSCEYRTVQCEFCNDKMIEKTLTDHYNEFCQEICVSCPNQCDHNLIIARFLFLFLAKQYLILVSLLFLNNSTLIYKTN